MKIAVVVRQVPDLIEALQIAPSETALDWGEVSLVVNESDDHALEQALLLKEAGGGTIVVVALDFGDADNTLYAAAAKGADRIVKIPWEEEAPPLPRAAAAMYAQAIRSVGADLVLVGIQAHDELEGVLPPLLAAQLGLPYVGVIRGVKRCPEAGSVWAWKEFPGAVMARMRVRLPAELGILGAEQPPRYVPVSRIRGAMKTTRFEECLATVPDGRSLVSVSRLYPPVSGSRAEMIAGSEPDVAARIVAILAEKGLVK